MHKQNVDKIIGNQTKWQHGAFFKEKIRNFPQTNRIRSKIEQGYNQELEESEILIFYLAFLMAAEYNQKNDLKQKINK